MSSVTDRHIRDAATPRFGRHARRDGQAADRGVAGDDRRHVRSTFNEVPLAPDAREPLLDAIADRIRTRMHTVLLAGT
jgi:hypothetical protein